MTIIGNIYVPKIERGGVIKAKRSEEDIHEWTLSMEVENLEGTKTMDG